MQKKILELESVVGKTHFQTNKQKWMFQRDNVNLGRIHKTSNIPNNNGRVSPNLRTHF